MAINFTLPNKKLTKKAQETLSNGFGLPIIASLIPSIPDYPVGDIPDGKNSFGIYYYGSCFIEKPNYGVYELNEVTNEYQNTAVALSQNYTIGDKQGCYFENCIVDVTGTNSIVKTEISGQNGSVKEWINSGDYTIGIRGFFAKETADVYPEQDSRLLGSYLKSPVTLNITNAFLNNVFGITKIVVESYNFFQQQGMRNIQYFQINAISDNDIVIQEQSKK